MRRQQFDLTPTLALIWRRWVESPAASFPGLAASVAYCKMLAASRKPHVRPPMAQNIERRHARRVQRVLDQGQNHPSARWMRLVRWLTAASENNLLSA